MNARIFILLASLAVHSSFAQGTFQNLNFENAVLVPVPGDPNGQVFFAPAFPGWAGTINGLMPTTAFHNNPSLSTPSIGLYSSGAGVLDGNYTAALLSYTIFSPASVSLFQTGLVPNDARSLRFLSDLAFGQPQGSVTVSLGGTPLAVSILQNFGSYNLYGADISAFAGQTAELRFSDAVSAGQNSGILLDAITFSPVAVPEPSTWALLALGAAAFCCAARRRRK